MSLAVVYCRTTVGMDSPQVNVEVHLSGGLPTFHLVGVPEASVRGSKDRVRSALINAGFKFPARRITVNLAPALLPKDGVRFDLAIAIGILVATGQIDQAIVAKHEFYGELSLGGDLRDFRGALSTTIAALETERTLIMPRASAESASRVNGAKLKWASDLIAVAGYLGGTQILSKPHCRESPSVVSSVGDLADVRGQAHACRALEIAAAGGHHLLMMGPPGSGKTMIASRLPGVLPQLTSEESLQSATLFDVAGLNRPSAMWKQPVFRSPHHTISTVALVGGGKMALPGELSLAHCGVLFLDELPEFSRATLEVMRQPLEERRVLISRAAARVTYPCRFQLIAAMNPCPCGYADDNENECTCSPEQLSRYHHKISGPLMDRIDMHIHVPRPATTVLVGEGSTADSSAKVRSRVTAARERQRFRGALNCELSAEQLNDTGQVTDGARSLLLKVAERRNLSARAWFRALKIARTIADLANSPDVLENHMAEALQLRVPNVA